MENLRLSLRARRRLRHDLIHVLDGVSLFLHAGYDLGYAWPETLRALGSDLHPDSLAVLVPGPGEAMTPCLARLTSVYPDPRHRIWFGVLGQLYAQGAGLVEAVGAVDAALRKEHELDLDAHCRNLPTKANVLLLLFYFPAAAALLILPLLLEILHAFPG